MGPRNWVSKRRNMRRWGIEHSIMTTAYKELVKPGQWPHNTTLVVFLGSDLRNIDSCASPRTPRDAQFPDPPSGAEWAVSFSHNSDSAEALLIRRDGTRHGLVTLKEEKFLYYHFNISGPEVDELFGNFGRIFP